MKKIVSLVLAIMMCISVICALAEDVPAPEGKQAVTENIAQGSGSIVGALEEPAALGNSEGVDYRDASSSRNYGNLIHYVPTLISIDDDDVIVYGYFINLNEDVAVKNFTDFSMTVYADGREIVAGEFGAINQFTVNPLNAVYQAFRFQGNGRNYQNGTYICEDADYCITSFGFTTVSN